MCRPANRRLPPAWLPQAAWRALFAAALVVAVPAYADNAPDCAVSLPPAEVRVSAEHAIPRIDTLHPAREIRHQLNSGPGSVALGMTQTSTTLSVDILLKAVSAAEADTLCARPQLDVVLRHSRVDIRLAREIQADDCVTAVVLEHEMKHVAIERDTLDWAAQQLQSRLQAHYADRVLRGSEAHIKARLVQDFDDTWTPVLEALLQSSGARHAAHDEQDSYGDAHACEGALHRVARTLQ